MYNSLVDYVLERGNKDYGQFHPNSSPQKYQSQSTYNNDILFNNRKLLQHLFSNNQNNQQDNSNQQQKQFTLNTKRLKISDLKATQLPSQLNYLSQKIHLQLNRKYLNLDSDLHRLQQLWLQKKIPQFYCYYFIKFAYANSYSRLHELILSEIQNMSSQKDSYTMVKRTIQARQMCLTSLRKQLSSLEQKDILQSIETIIQEKHLKQKIKRQQQQNYTKHKHKQSYQSLTNNNITPNNRSWKNKLQSVFELIEHLRKLTVYCVQLIKSWKLSVYNITQDPRRYRQRVIFYHHGVNYLLKILIDVGFVKGTILNNYIQLSTTYDPFLLKPVMNLQNKLNNRQLSQQQQIWLQLIKPLQKDMTKIVQSLIILAQQDYDQQRQSGFIQKKGQLQTRKINIAIKRQGLSSINDHKIHTSRPNNSNSNIGAGSDNKLVRYGSVKVVNNKRMSEQKNIPKQILPFDINKKSQITPQQLQSIKQQRVTSSPTKNRQLKSHSLQRLQKVNPDQLRKLSPYLSRNQLLKKAQQVVQFQHKYKLAHQQYIENVKKSTKQANAIKNPKLKQSLQQIVQQNKQVINNRIFNKYIEQNVRQLQQANKKKYLFKNNNNINPYRNNSPIPTINRVNKTKSQLQQFGYNKVSYVNKKQAQYQRNLNKYLPKQHNTSQNYQSLQKFHHQYLKPQQKKNDHKQSPTKQKINIINGNFNEKRQKRAIIEISDRGIKAGSKIVQFQLTGKKGKNVGEILATKDNDELQKIVNDKLGNNIPSDSPNVQQHQQQQTNNLFTLQSPNQVIILRQQPQKLQQLKQSLYNQIKQQLLLQLKNEQTRKKDDLQRMVQQQKKRRIDQIIEQRRLEQERKKEQQQRMRQAQMEKQRKKLDIPIRVEAIQYAQENLSQWYNNKLFAFNKQTFMQLFTIKSQKQLIQSIENTLHCIFFKAYLQDQQIGYAILEYDHKHKNQRRFIIKYMAVKDMIWFLSMIHQLLQYMWKNDPFQQLQIKVYSQQEKITFNTEEKKLQEKQKQKQQQGTKIIEDLKHYVQKINGTVTQSYPYSNIKQTNIIIYRTNQQLINQQLIIYPKNFLFSPQFHLKTQLLCSTLSLSQLHTPIIDNTLESFTSYVFLLQQIFRKYLTPDQIIQLRQNSSNIRRLKDIFRLILQLEKTDPKVQELKIIQGIGLDDLYHRLRDKIKKPQKQKIEEFYSRYYWNIFSDKVKDNRLLLAILETHLKLPYSINTGLIEQKNYFRLNINSNILILKSSVYPSELIYLLPTDNPKIKLFFINAQPFKLMRIQIFVFLNLVFNNIVSDTQRFVGGMWVPQFSITENKQSSNKSIKRITDFSISMKKHFYLSQEIFFCNHQYIKNGILPMVKNTDVIFLQSVIVGLMHTDIEKASTGMPIYAKLIDKEQFF